MEKEVYEVKQAIYAGMSIYKNLKESLILVLGKAITQQDKKYLSFYLGLLNTQNSISESLNTSGYRLYKKVRYDELSMEEYEKLYNEYFIDVLKEIDFLSIDNFFEFLINKDIIKVANRVFEINTNNIIRTGNKQLIKK